MNAEINNKNKYWDDLYDYYCFDWFLWTIKDKKPNKNIFYIYVFIILAYSSIFVILFPYKNVFIYYFNFDKIMF